MYLVIKLNVHLIVLTFFSPFCFLFEEKFETKFWFEYFVHRTFEKRKKMLLYKLSQVLPNSSLLLVYLG